MLALRHRRRGHNPAVSYLERLAGCPEETLRQLLVLGDRRCRSWVLEVLSGRGVLTAGWLLGRALHDVDPVIALWSARQLGASAKGLPDEDCFRLLDSPRAAVRAFAAGDLTGREVPQDMLRLLLVDRSGAVRSAARWQWGLRWGTPGPVYRDVLERMSRPREIAAALQGLEDIADPSLPAVAVAFLDHPSPAVRRAAVVAIGWRGSDGDIPGRLVPLLHDSSAKVATRALRYS